MEQRSNAIPSRDELAELCKTMTLDQIADHYETYQRRVWNWLHKYGLKQVLKPPGKKKIVLDVEYIIKCVRSGMYLDDIAKAMNVSQPTVSSRLQDVGLSVTKIREDIANEQKQGHNCSYYGKHDCKYWCYHTNSCNYIIDVGHRRPCPPSNCTVYEKGKRRKDNEW